MLHTIFAVLLLSQVQVGHGKRLEFELGRHNFTATAKDETEGTPFARGAGELTASAGASAGTTARRLPSALGMHWNDLSYHLPGWMFFKNVKELGVGSFGAVWGGTALQGACSNCEKGKEYAIKVFYKTKRNGMGYPVTWQHAARDRDLGKELDQVSAECELGDLVKAQGKGKGKELIMGCVANRVDKNKMDNTHFLYLILDHGGRGIDTEWDKQLMAGGSQPSLSAGSVQKSVKAIMFQSLTALAFMSSGGFIHHDIKSENMVMSLAKDESSHLQTHMQLIDFGAAINTKKPSPSSTVSNENAPPEWATYGAFDPSNPAAFDVYSMGHVFMELLTGNTLTDVLVELKPWNADRQQLVWTYTSSHTLRGKELVTLMESFWKQRRFTVQRRCFNVFKADPEFVRFLDLVGKMFTHRATDRPTAQQILGDPRIKWLEEGVERKEEPGDSAQEINAVRVRPIYARLSQRVQEQADRVKQRVLELSSYKFVGTGVCAVPVYHMQIKYVHIQMKPTLANTEAYMFCMKTCDDIGRGCGAFALSTSKSCRLYVDDSGVQAWKKLPLRQGWSAYDLEPFAPGGELAEMKQKQSGRCMTVSNLYGHYQEFNCFRKTAVVC